MALWIIILTAACITGLSISRAKRIDLKDSARWIDSKLKTNEAFSAFLTCSQRHFSGLPDEAISEKAGSILRKEVNILWPYKKLSRQLGMTVGVLVITGLIVGLWFPETKAGVLKPVTSVHIKQDNPRQNDSAGKNKKKINQFSSKTQKDIARLLFPQNKKLALEVEKALKNGDMKVLEKLLQKDKFDIENQIKNTDLPEEREKLKNELLKQKKLSSMLFNESENGENTAGESKNQRQGINSENLNEVNQGQENKEEMKKQKQTGSEDADRHVRQLRYC